MATKYPMTETKKGLVLFSSDVKDDVLYDLAKTFDEKNFQVIYKDNTTDINAILSYIEFAKTKYKNEKFNSIIIILSTNITQNDLLLPQDQKYSLDKLQAEFCEKEFYGVPKIFIINSRRGDQEDKGNLITTDSNETIERDGERPDIKPYTIPMEADFLIMYSCCDGYQSFPEYNFIETLNGEINESIMKTDFISILTSVSRKIALKEIDSGLKQMPMIHSRLKSQLYFNPTCNENFPKPYYNIDNKKIPVIMFNHFTYSKALDGYYQRHSIQITPRSKTSDMSDLEKIFLQMNFRVSSFENLKRGDILNILRTKSMENDIDGIIVVFSTHGTNGELLAYDEIININNDVLSIFKGNKNLSGKPKMFFINACRGSKGSVGVGNSFTESECSPNVVNLPMEVDYTATHFPDEIKNLPDEIKNLPETSDFLISYSTAEGNVSFIDDGKIFYINTLNDVFDEYKNQKKDILSLLTIVHERVAINYETLSTNPEHDEKKQMPCFDSTLIKTFLFGNN